jgi:hypothetical protein
MGAVGFPEGWAQRKYYLTAVELALPPSLFFPPFTVSMAFVVLRVLYWLVSLRGLLNE